MIPTGDRAAWLQGPKATCSGVGPMPGRAWRLVLLGAPGVGKGTQATLLHDRLGCCPLSTGDVFRHAKACGCAGSPAMENALGFMKRGELVPDATVIDMVRERARCLQCGHGFMLDGFPRTVQQARTLDAMLAELHAPLDAVLSFELPTPEIVARLSGRRTCSGCKRTFHLMHSPPKAAGICDDCGAPLFQREDDRDEAIAVRLKAYDESTAPLADFYRAKGLLRVVSAEGSPDDVFARALKALGSEAMVRA